MTSPSLGQYQKLFTENLLSEQLSFSESEDFLSHFKQMFKNTDKNEEAIDRFNIYRNNVTLSLSTAIGDTFPVVKKLIGEECFNAAAIEFVRGHPPKHSSLLFYGEEFIEFIKIYPACSELPYLSDIAQLEWCYIRAFHADDVALLDNDTLQKIPPENLSNIFFTVHPSVQLMQSDWPVDTIWEENLKDEVGIVDLQNSTGCHLLIYRQELQVTVIALTADCFHFLTALTDDKNIADAWSYTVARQQQQNRPDIDENDLGGMLGYLLGLSLFTSAQP